MRFRAASCFVALAFAMGNAAACGETLPNAPTDGSDGAVDGAGADGSQQGDGAPSDGGPAVTTACAFSDGFDRPAADVSAGWTETRTNRGTVTLEGATFKALTNAGTALDARTAALVKTFDAPPKSVTCKFDMRIDTPPNSADNYVDALDFELEGVDGTKATLRLPVEHTRISVREDRTAPTADAKCDCPVSEKVFTAEAKTGEWTNISFTTNFTDVSVNQNGVIIGSHAFPALDVRKATMLLGVVNFSTGATWHSYRNLSCTLGC